MITIIIIVIVVIIIIIDQVTAPHLKIIYQHPINGPLEYYPG